MNQPLTNPDPLLNLKASAPYVGFEPESLRVALHRGTYPILNAGAIRIGRKIYFRQSTLEQFLNSRQGIKPATRKG